MSVLEALKMYLQSLCFKLLMFSVRDNLLRCSSKDFCEWYIASKCLPLFENIYREIFCWKTLLPLQILPPSQYDPGGQRDRPRPPPLLALLNNTWSKCQPSTMTGNVSYSGISFFLRGKKKTQRHFHLPLRTLKMWKFSKRNSESDKDKQGLGDLSLAILSVLVWTLLKGFLYSDCEKAFLFDVLISTASKGKSCLLCVSLISLLFSKGRQTLVIPLSRQYVESGTVVMRMKTPFVTGVVLQQGAGQVKYITEQLEYDSY